MANFTDILNKPAESVEKPKPRPPGTYLSIVNGPHKQREVKSKDGTEFPVVEVSLKLMQALEDVDQAALAEAGGVGNIVNQSFFLTTNEGNDNSWVLLKFLTDHLGLDKTGKTLSQLLAEAPGKQVLVTLKHEIYVDKSTNEPAIAVRVAGTAKV